MKITIILTLFFIISCGNSHSSNDNKILNTLIDNSNYYLLSSSFKSKDLKFSYNTASSNIYNKYSKLCEKELSFEKQEFGKAPVTSENLDKIDKCATSKVLKDVVGLKIMDFIEKYK